MAALVAGGVVGSAASTERAVRRGLRRGEDLGVVDLRGDVDVRVEAVPGRGIRSGATGEVAGLPDELDMICEGQATRSMLVASPTYFCNPAAARNFFMR